MGLTLVVVVYLIKLRFGVYFSGS